MQTLRAVTLCVQFSNGKSRLLWKSSPGIQHPVETVEVRYYRLMNNKFI